MSDFYNRASAHKLGWEPSWFGADEFDEKLAEKIKEPKERWASRQTVCVDRRPLHASSPKEKRLMN